MGCGGSKKNSNVSEPHKLAGAKDKSSGLTPRNGQNIGTQQTLSDSSARNIITANQKPQDKPAGPPKVKDQNSPDKNALKHSEVKPQEKASKPPEIKNSEPSGHHANPNNIQKTKEDLKSAALENTEIKPIQKNNSLKSLDPRKSENTLKLEESKSQKILRNPSQQKLERLKSPASDAEIIQSQSLIDFKPPTTYNKVIWAKQKASSNERHKPAVAFNVVINGATENLTFNDFQITHINSKNIPKVVDCIAYIYKTPEDLDEIRKINTEFRYVWSQGVICENEQLMADVEPLSDEIGLAIVNCMDDFMRKVYNDDRKLYILLKEVFMKIDKDGSGYIDMSELALATEQLGENPNQSDIQNAMQEMDLNRDGKINFQEFVYWWKRGRQGAISIQKMAGNIASKFAANVPGSLDLLRNIGIGRRTIDKAYFTKEFSLRVGQGFADPKLDIHLSLGKSAKREQILQEANQALSFNMRESWIAVAFTAKQGNASSAHSQLAQETSKTLLSSFLASAYDGNSLQNSMGTSAQAVGNKVFVGTWIDLNNEKFCSIHDHITLFEKVFRSPVDDYLDLSLQFKNGIKNLQSNEMSSNDMLFEAFRLKITYVHWVKFLEMILTLRDKRSILSDIFPFSFLLMSGNMEMRFKNVSEVPKVFSPASIGTPPQAGDTLEAIKQAMKAYIVDTPYMVNVTKEIIDNFEPKIEIIFRFNNLGLKLEINADGLSEFYQSLISG